MDAIDDFKTGKLDEIYLIYTRIENALTSEPTMVRLLPLDRAHLQPAPKGLGDPKGDVEMFPSAWTVFEQIAPIYMHGMIFGAMTESFCAEQSARMTAMDSATKNANDMIRELQLEYNRTRQGSITQEITEIIGGRAGPGIRYLPFRTALRPAFRKGKAFGRPGVLAWTAKASHFGRGGSAQALTERARMLTCLQYTDYKRQSK